MIRIPISQVKEKIAQSTGMSEADIDTKIDQKLQQLSGLISREGAAHIVANELGIKLFENSGKIKDIYPGMRSIQLSAKVTAVYEKREFSRSDGSQGKVASAMVADDTGRTRLVGWGALADSVSQVKEGDIVAIKNGYVRENNRGYKEVHLNDKASIEINPAGVTVEVGTSSMGGGGAPDNFERKRISDLSEADSAVEIVGFITQVFDLRFFEVCPECGKRIKEENGEWTCPTHGVQATPDYGYVLNIFVEDDSSDRIRIVLFRNLIEQLLGKSKDDMLMLKNDPSLFEGIKTDLLGEPYKMKGRIKKNTFFDRIEFVPNVISKASADEELANANLSAEPSQ